MKTINLTDQQYELVVQVLESRVVLLDNLRQGVVKDEIELTEQTLEAFNKAV